MPSIEGLADFHCDALKPKLTRAYCTLLWAPKDPWQLLPIVIPILTAASTQKMKYFVLNVQYFVKSVLYGLKLIYNVNIHEELPVAVRFV